MTAKKFNERSWWRRLARRVRAAEPRSNRLSHFEPLEPRMVLSAGIWMDGADLWHGSQHEELRFEASTGHGGEAAEYGVAADRQLFVGPPVSFASYEAIELRDTVLAPHDLGMGLWGGGPQFIPFSSTETAEGEYTQLTPALVSPAAPTLSLFTGPIAPANFSWYLSAAPASDFHVLILPEHASHDYSDSPADSGSTLQIVSVRPVTLPAYGGGSDMGFMALMALARRVENPPPPPSDDHHVPGPVSEDLVPGATKSTTSSLVAQESGSILAIWSSSNVARLTNFMHVAASDDDGTVSQRPLEASGESESQSEDSESAELVTDDVLAAKRKLVSGESRANVQTQLAGLVDLPVVRVTESLFRELLALYDNASQAQAQAAATTGTPDDGLVELLAADASSLASRRIALPAGQQQQGTTLDSNVALYQSLEIAGLEDVASAAAAAQAAPLAPAEQLAKAD
jgi:hypothetical protein